MLLHFFAHVKDPFWVLLCKPSKNKLWRKFTQPINDPVSTFVRNLIKTQLQMTFAEVKRFKFKSDTSEVIRSKAAQKKLEQAAPVQL